MDDGRMCCICGCALMEVSADGECVLAVRLSGWCVQQKALALCMFLYDIHPSW